MPGKYSHIQEHEKEIQQHRRQGMTLHQIGEKLGFTHKEMRGFLSQYSRKQRKLAASAFLATGELWSGYCNSVIGGAAALFQLFILSNWYFCRWLNATRCAPPWKIFQPHIVCVIHKIWEICTNHIALLCTID